MKKFMLFSVSALVLAALALAAFTPGSLAAGKVSSIARAAIAGKSPSTDDTPQPQATATRIEIEKHNGQDDAQPTLEATPDDKDMEATEAPEVKNPDVNDEAGKLEFSGTLKAMNASSWMIGDRSVLVNAQTEIKGTFAVGDMVKVEAFLNTDGKLTAREIQKAETTLEDNSGKSSSDDGSADLSSNSSPVSSSTGSSEDNSGRHGGSDDGSGHH